MECVERDRHLFKQFSTLTVSGVGPGGRIRRVLAPGLLALDALDGIDWPWPAMDGAMTKAPLGGRKNRPQILRIVAKAASNAAC